MQNLDVGTSRLADQVGVLVDGATAGPLMGDGLLPRPLFTVMAVNGSRDEAVFDGSE